MKLLTDFDGTLTSIEREYAFEESHLFSSIRTLCHSDAEFADIINEARNEVLSHPQKHGWLYNNRISAYSDEDLFMTIASQMTLLDTWLSQNRSKALALKDALNARNSSFMELNEDAHRAMNAEPLSDANTPETRTARALQRFLDKGGEVVVVSNSATDRIVEKLRFAGLPAVDHDAHPDAPLRVRGNAQKFALDDTPDPLSFCGRTVDVARARYASVIRDEHPDLITGDVFSLDIALPFAIACNDPSFDNARICLLKRAYTPNWALDAISAPPCPCHAKLQIINSFDEII